MILRKVPIHTFPLLRISLLILFTIFFTKSSFSQDYIVDEIKFTHKDTKTFDDKALKDAIALSEGQIYNPKALTTDISKLKKFYFDNGFFDSKIDTAIIYNDDDGEVVVRFTIWEKKHYRVDSLVYHGLENTSPDIVIKADSIKTIKSGDFYNKVLVIQQTNEVVDLLQNNGYMNASVKQDSGTIIIKHDSSVTVKLSFQRADTIYKFGKTKINIKDNVYGVDEHLMTKVITFKEGDIYSKTEKLATERNMSQYGIVQSARLEPDSNYTGETVDFTANISLNKRNEVTPYIEATNIDNYFYAGAGAKYINKYFLGGGRVFTLGLQALFNSPRINRTEAVASVTQPYLFNLNSTLTDKITIGLYNVDGFKNYYMGNLTTIGYYISDHTFYNSASLDLDEELVWFKFDNPDSTGTLTQFNSFFSTTFVHDNTNSLTSPSRGFYHSIQVGEAGLIPSLVIKVFNKNVYYSQFVKIFTANRFYFNLNRLSSTLVFATKFNVGDIMEFGSGDRLIPVQPIYKFFSGGSNSLRGWNPKSNGVLADTKLGGDFILEGSLELRKKLFPNSETFTKNIGMAVFFDYGNVWEKHKDFRFNQIALAIGFGIRYDLFLGPVRIDVGWKLYNPTDSQGEKWLFDKPSRIFKDKLAITFGIGQAF